MRLFRVMGINVYVHWTWFLVAAIQLQNRGLFQSVHWHAAMYLSLFAIVLLHEFGHALACRSVGGRANRIVLWPLGGVAFVEPPPRPGPVLWSIVAGPLVNVLLVPVTLVFAAWAHANARSLPGDLVRYASTMAMINTGLLVFNLLPIYPLDGGQIVQSILWFFIGRARSLRFVAAVGLVAALAVGVFAIVSQAWWTLILAVFIAFEAWRGFSIARYLAAQEAAEQAEKDRWSQIYGRWDELGRR